MNMFDEAAALSGTIKMRGISQSKMAKLLGVSQSYIANKLRLLSFDDEARSRISAAKLTERHARAILRLKGADERKRALDLIIERGLSVAESEALVDLIYEPTEKIKEGRSTALEKTERFKKSLSESVTLLRSFGVNATLDKSYYGSRLYITVTIDESLA